MKSKKKTAPIAKEQIEAFEELITQFNEESERAAVILATAKLDYLLYQLLNRFMVASSL